MTTASAALTTSSFQPFPLSHVEAPGMQRTAAERVWWTHRPGVVLFKRQGRSYLDSVQGATGRPMPAQTGNKHTQRHADLWLSLALSCSLILSFSPRSPENLNIKLLSPCRCYAPPTPVPLFCPFSPFVQRFEKRTTSAIPKSWIRLPKDDPNGRAPDPLGRIIRPPNGRHNLSILYFVSLPLLPLVSRKTRILPREPRGVPRLAVYRYNLPTPSSCSCSIAGLFITCYDITHPSWNGTPTSFVLLTPN